MEALGRSFGVIDDPDVPRRQAIVDRINLALHRLGVRVPLIGNETVRVCSGELVRLIGRNQEMVQNALVTSRASAEEIGQQIELQLDQLWFMGQVAQ